MNPLISQSTYNALVRPSETPEGKALRLEQLAVLRQSRNEQAQALQNQEATVNQLRGAEVKTDLSPLLALSDSWTGSKLLDAYKRPDTQQDRLLKISQLEKGLATGKKDLSQEDLNILKALHPEKKEGISIMDALKLEQEKNKPTAGQEALDKSFAKDYEDYYATGGYAGVEKNLKTLEDAKAALANDTNGTLSGGFSTSLPDSIRARVNPESVALEQNIKETALASLRQALGPQFTEKEGERIMQMAYDPRLPADKNIAKLDKAMEYIRTRAQQREKSARYYEQNKGTLQGFSPAQERSVPQAGGEAPAAVSEEELNSSPEVQAVLKKHGKVK